MNPIVAQLIKKVQTNNPFQIAAALGITVVFESLGEVRGYYSKSHQQKVIHINSEMEHPEQIFTCAHEVGHALLHPYLNTPFLRRNTLFRIGKLEGEANRFAVDLLYDDAELQPFLERPLSDAAHYMGVSEELADYRMRSVEPRFSV